MTVLRTMWGKVVVVRTRARHAFVLGTVSVSLVLPALPGALALDPDRRISQYGHTVWRIQDGAISPPTNIAQTTDGFLWVGTAQGLMRFDGVRFMPWQAPQGQNLPGTHFSALLGSRDGSLWIGTTRGLARSKDGQLRTYTDLEHPPGVRLNSIPERLVKARPGDCENRTSRLFSAFQFFDHSGDSSQFSD